MGIDNAAIANAALLSQVHHLVAREFLRSGISVETLAGRLGQPVDLVGIWLIEPQDYSLGDLSNMLFAISGAVLDVHMPPIGGAEQEAV